MKYEALIFDWDGCIANTLPVYLNSLRGAYNKRDLFPTDQEIIHRLGRWKKSTDLGVSTRDIKNFSQEVIDDFNRTLGNVALYDGAHELLKKLKQERVAGRLGGLALLTNSYLEMVHQPLHDYDLWNVFDVIVSSTIEVKDKPSPRGIHLAFGEMGFASRAKPSPNSALVGDSDKDIMAARNAGIDSVWINHKENRDIYGEGDIARFRALRPTYEVTSFDELDDLLFQ